MWTWLATAGGFGLELGRPDPVTFPPDALPKGILIVLVGVLAIGLWLRAGAR